MLLILATFEHFEHCELHGLFIEVAQKYYCKLMELIYGNITVAAKKKVR